MESQSIILHIFGRKFPARVSREEAAAVKLAAEEIHAKMKAFKAEYTAQDDIDIAIMCCLDIMTEYLRFKTQTATQTASVLNELSVLEQKLDHTIALSEKN
ncbi:MAG: cell division protein ZapA [Bacteroidetes bacterium]|nr:MAG: cell division protein ZapA [Bacteroidota bacterium]